MKKKQNIKINGKYLKDLEMMLGFLEMVNDGTSLNSTTFINQLTDIAWTLAPMAWEDTATKIGHGDGTCLRTCSSKHPTTCLNTLLQSSLRGLPSLLDASISKTASSQ